MMGERARLGFLVPPGNPTVEPEMTAMTPRGVTVHYTRLNATGVTGSLDGQEERNRQQIESLPHAIRLLIQVRPNVIVLAHTATSYTLGVQGEKELIGEIEQEFKCAFITAFGCVVRALHHLGIKRIALGTPYAMSTTLRGKALLEAHGFDVRNCVNLAGVKNIYDETAARAFELGRMADHKDADAVFLSGVGMPTIEVIEQLETELGKPVVSAASSMMWNALRVAGIKEAVPGYGRLLQS